MRRAGGQRPLVGVGHRLSGVRTLHPLVGVPWRATNGRPGVRRASPSLGKAHGRLDLGVPSLSD